MGVEGLDELTEGLRQFPAIARGEVEKALQKALVLLQGAMAEYPAPPAGSAYRRTGTLGRLWASARRYVYEERGHVLEGRVGNAVPYGPYVQDPDRQAAVHRGRWRTTEQVIRDNEEAVGVILTQAGGVMVKEMAR